MGTTLPGSLGPGVWGVLFFLAQQEWTYLPHSGLWLPPRFPEPRATPFSPSLSRSQAGDRPRAERLLDRAISLPCPSVGDEHITTSGR